MQQCCNEWKHLLKLDEWQVLVEINRPEETNGQTGQLSFTRINSQAVIKLPAADDAVNNVSPFGYIAEEALVRHLLMLRFEMIQNLDANAEIYFRRALKILAHLLVNLKDRSDALDMMIKEMQAGFEQEESARKTSPAPVKKVAKPLIIG